MGKIIKRIIPKKAKAYPIRRVNFRSKTLISTPESAQAKISDNCDTIALVNTLP